MAFSDPQSVTVNAVAIPLPRVSSGADSGAFASSDGLVRLTVSHSYGKRYRRTLQLSHSKVAADPFQAAVNQKYAMRAYLVVDAPITGYTVAQQKEIVDALTAYLTALSGANTTKLLGGEN